VYVPLFQDNEFSGMHVFAGQQIETDDEEDDFANYVDGPRLQAKLDNPRWVTENEQGDLFFGEGQVRRIRRISSEGIVSTFVGGGEIGPAVRRDGSGADARLSDGGPMAIGPDGLLYFVDYKFLRSVTPTGIVKTLDDQLEGAIAMCSGLANDLLFTRSGEDASCRGRVRTELCRYDLQRSNIDVVFRTRVGEALGGIVVHGGQIFAAGDGRIYAVEPTSGEVTLVVDGLDLHFDYALIMDADEDGNLYLGGFRPMRVDISTKKVSNVAEFADLDIAGNEDVHVKRHDPYKGHLLVTKRHVILVTDHPVHPWNPQHFRDFRQQPDPR
jgi:hypothetical protein